MKRTLPQLVFIVLLLFGQQCALAHAAWHVQHDSPTQDQRHDDSSFHGELCQMHGLLAQVTGSGPGTTFNLAVDDSLPHYIGDNRQLFNTTTVIVARCRGPPSLV